MLRVGLGGITGTNITSIGLGVSVGGGGGCKPVDQIDGALVEGQTFDHSADGVVAWTLTVLPASGSDTIYFRVQSEANGWGVRWYSNAALQLIEIVDGSVTIRSAATSAFVAGDRVAVVMSGTTIDVYVNGVRRTNYTSAVNFATATNGVVANVDAPAVASDLKTWTLACRGMEGV